MNVPNMFRCLLVTRTDPDSPASLGPTELPIDALPQGEVTIRVHYSSLNFKDALATQAHPGVVKKLPHIPGIDAAGVVEQSTDAEFSAGDQVVVTGYDLGQGHFGGWSQLVRVPAAWVVPLPAGLTLREAMWLGTAGFTAAQSVLALERNEVLPGNGELVISGATGGVGSLAIQMLSGLGYRCVALTGKESQHEALKNIGASRVIDRSELEDSSNRPLLSATWAGGVDTVGGNILTNILKSTRYGGCVTACGLVAGAELSMSVYPFLLRGIALCGIASADCPRTRRLEIWRRLASDLKPAKLETFGQQVNLADVPQQVEKMLAGQIVGRTLIDLTDNL